MLCVRARVCMKSRCAWCAIRMQRTELSASQTKWWSVLKAFPKISKKNKHNKIGVIWNSFKYKSAFIRPIEKKENRVQPFFEGCKSVCNSFSISTVLFFNATCIVYIVLWAYTRNANQTEFIECLGFIPFSSSLSLFRHFSPTQTHSLTLISINRYLLIKLQVSVLLSDRRSVHLQFSRYLFESLVAAAAACACLC